jgi:mycothiol system anti-sigma-R factor
MSLESNPFLNAGGTKPSCMQMLQIILDGEATPDQREYFRDHMDKCMPCFKTYEVDMTIKEMLRIKCCGDQVPKELVEQLKNQIKQKIAS